MTVTITSTSKIVDVNGVPARIWEGTTDSGIKLHCFMTRVAIDKDDEAANAEFLRELQSHQPPTAEVAAIPLRLIL